MDPVDRREELVRRVAFSLHGKAGGREVPGEAGDRPLPMEERARVACFRERFEAQGGRFFSGPAIEPFLPHVGEALRLAGVAGLLFPGEDAWARGVAEALAPFGPFPIVSADEARRIGAPPFAGIQTAERAVAETGSIVQTSLGGKTLLPGLLSEVHVSLLAPGILVDRLEDCLEPLAASLPRNVSFITGPSRTGDIEQTITVGAHGPKSVIAVLLTSPSP